MHKRIICREALPCDGVGVYTLKCGDFKFLYFHETEPLDSK